MSDILSDTVVVIPSKRKPPIVSLVSYPTRREVIVISDPSVVSDHRRWIKDSKSIFSNVRVVVGKVGMIPQSAECYRQSYKAGYKFYFRMDDDLHPRTFVHKDGLSVDLEKAMIEARRCASKLGTSLNGFVNSSVRIWMNEGYRRSYGLIHGGAHLCVSSKDPSKFIDESLPAYEDVYRSAAHREVDGAVGRVCFIGLDKRASLRDSSMKKTAAVQDAARSIILKRFPKTVTCNGYRTLDAGKQRIPNWRLVRGDTYRK